MSSRPDILAIDQFPPAIKERLKSLFTVHQYEGIEALSPYANKIRGVATGGGSGLPRPIMDALPALEVISVNGVGTDQIDLEDARQRKIGVATTLGTLTDDVADMAIVLTLAVMRETVLNDRLVREGKWPTQPLPLSRSVTKKRMGIAGFGHIGQAIAHRAAAFGMDLAYFNSRPRAESQLRFEPDLKALAEWSDVLVLAVSGGPRSANMVNAEILDALGPDGVLINIARGSVVDEAALLSALKQKRIAGAGLDVFQNEPNINPEFFTLENTVLQAHQASATIETRTVMGNLMVDNLVAHFEGKSLLTPIL
ncbi:dihydrofolate reductase [Gluconobacter oxydans]|uniref:2-hydroxyacid dehydrogenase n=1 Tax=Gluconobacter thailandicus TaxID=257438 RepID=UPI0002997579|nr:2-hydroxyacid dehydrogenase [Gluconobacter thailandicus]AFW01530.1 putative 2-hydroxyacid dehydrogenase [Gluconobacter oxydans H24]ANQ42832.1 dihydrofolate reductase [Gluconobacter oxydans]